MKKVKIKEIRTAYKISIIAAFVALLINVSSFFLVLLPVYELVGNTEMSETEKDDKLERAENIGNAIFNLTIVLTVLSVGSGGYGVYQDVRSKPKK